MKDRIVNQIKEHRLRLGQTQEELAEKAGVSRQSINSIERGRYTPSLPLALKFARVFNIPMDKLFILQEVEENND